jgi:putative transcriptional regulator
MYERLKQLRKEQSLTQAEMANMLGLSDKSSYSTKECGLRKFTIVEAYKIAKFFNTSIESIFFNQEVGDMVNRED